MSSWHTIDKDKLVREIDKLDAQFTALVGFHPEKAAGKSLGSFADAVQAMRFLATRDALVYVVNSLSGGDE